jgi:hypothetical protein
MPLQLIGDGYDCIPVTIPAFGIWPACSIQFRPALEEELQEYDLKISRAASGLEKALAMAQMLASHLQGWDVVGKDRQPRPVTEENIRKVPSPILRKMFDAVTCWSVEAKLVEEQKN